MLSLFCGLWHSACSIQEYSVVILGLDGAGKTTFLQATKPIYSDIPALPPEQIAPTIGLNISKIENRGIRLLLQDLGGQQSLRSLWDKYLPVADAVIFVIDSTCDDFKLEDTKKAMAHISTFIEDIPLLFIANKQDLSHPRSLLEIQAAFKQFSLESRPLHFAAVDSLRGLGVKDAIDWLLENIVERKVA